MSKLRVESSIEPARVGRSVLPQSFAVIESERSRGRPDIRVEFEVRDGAPICTAVHLHAVGNVEVRASDLAQIRLTDWLDMAVNHLVLGEVRTTGPGEYLISPSSDIEDGRRGIRDSTNARRRRTNLDLARVAAIYRANVRNAPTKAIADEFEVSQRSAVGYVRRARDAGYLGESIPGKAGERDE